MKTPVAHSFVPGNPYSAVIPHDGSSKLPLEPQPKLERTNPQDSFFKSRIDTLPSFPQVIHLLVEQESPLGDNLSRETGLPLVNYEEDGVGALNTLLNQPEYANGFVLEGIPESETEAQKLDQLLSATAPEDHRVLGWELADSQHQEVLDHYLDSGLLWMVPSDDGSSQEAESLTSMLECLSGLPLSSKTRH